MEPRTWLIFELRMKKYWLGRGKWLALDLVGNEGGGGICCDAGDARMRSFLYFPFELKRGKEDR